MKLKFESTDILHLVICLVCAFLVSSFVAMFTIVPAPAIWAGFFAGVALGMGKELGDHMATGNSWSQKDIIFDFIGSTIGCWGGMLCYLIHV